MTNITNITLSASLSNSSNYTSHNVSSDTCHCNKITTGKALEVTLLTLFVPTVAFAGMAAISVYNSGGNIGQDYPWSTLGFSGAVGFTLGVLLVIGETTALSLADCF